MSMIVLLIIVFMTGALLGIIIGPEVHSWEGCFEEGLKDDDLKETVENYLHRKTPKI